jgi:CBS domain-containing protein/mannitol/fructose-specific phosphotransferase system IIA component (Ntr-type)
VKLREVLRSEHVIVPLQATTVREATEQLARRLVEPGAVAHPKRLYAVIQNAWPEDLATVGEHAFLPHFRTEAVRNLLTAVGIARTPVPSERARQRAARVIIFVVAPPRETPTYLQVMGALARALSDPGTMQGLHDARSAADVMALPAFGAIDLPSHLLVRDVMTPGILSIGPETRMGEAARLMVERDVRALPVVDDSGALLGMVTHRELLRYLIPDYLQRTKSGEFRAPTKSQVQRGSSDPQLIPVREAMARSVLCLAEDQTLSDVANLMNSKDVDRFPVVREGKVVGFLTRADLIRRLIAPSP